MTVCHRTLEESCPVEVILQQVISLILPLMDSFKGKHHLISFLILRFVIFARLAASEYKMSHPQNWTLKCRQMLQICNGPTSTLRQLWQRSPETTSAAASSTEIWCNSSDFRHDHVMNFSRENKVFNSRACLNGTGRPYYWLIISARAIWVSNVILHLSLSKHNSARYCN